MMRAVMKQEMERFMVRLHLGCGESSSTDHLSWSIHLSPIQERFDKIFRYSESKRDYYEKINVLASSLPPSLPPSLLPDTDRQEDHSPL